VVAEVSNEETDQGMEKPEEEVYSTECGVTTMEPTDLVDVKTARALAERHAMTLPKSLRASKGNKFGQNAIRYYKLHQTTTITSDAANTIAYSFSVRDPSGAVDYSSIAALFDEYKVIGYKLQFFPYYPNGSTLTVNYDALAIAFDSDDAVSTAPSSLATVIGYENFKAFPIWKHWTHRVKSIPEYVASNSDGQASPGWNRVGFECQNGRLLIYATGLEASTTYGRFFITYEIAFRTRT